MIDEREAGRGGFGSHTGMAGASGVGEVEEVDFR
jgi:hypothetical protein